MTPHLHFPVKIHRLVILIIAKPEGVEEPHGGDNAHGVAVLPREVRAGGGLGEEGRGEAMGGRGKGGKAERGGGRGEGGEREGKG